MAYQVPKANHPWRRYQNRFVKIEVEIEKVEPKRKVIKPVREFLSEVINNWDNLEITTNLDANTWGTFKAKELGEDKIAAWMVGLLKRNYIQTYV